MPPWPLAKAFFTAQPDAFANEVVAVAAQKAAADHDMSEFLTL